MSEITGLDPRKLLLFERVLQQEPWLVPIFLLPGPNENHCMALSSAIGFDMRLFTMKHQWFVKKLFRHFKPVYEHPGHTSSTCQSLRGSRLVDIEESCHRRDCPAAIS